MSNDPLGFRRSYCTFKSTYTGVTLKRPLLGKKETMDRNYVGESQLSWDKGRPYVWVTDQVLLMFPLRRETRFSPRVLISH